MSSDAASGPGEPQDPVNAAGSAGPDLVREALDRARADGAARRAEAASQARSGASAQARGRRRAGARESRLREKGEPVTFGLAIEALLAARGWTAEAAAGSILATWPELVGPEIAERAVPVSIEGGVLTVQAESTAWATQLRLMSRQLLATLQAAKGVETVTKVIIKAPTAPSWNKGPRRVKGLGPRDTYG